LQRHLFQMSPRAPLAIEASSPTSRTFTYRPQGKVSRVWEQQGPRNSTISDGDEAIHSKQEHGESAPPQQQGDGHMAQENMVVSGEGGQERGGTSRTHWIPIGVGRSPAFHLSYDICGFVMPLMMLSVDKFPPPPSVESGSVSNWGYMCKDVDE
ncbi:hypothetical protein CLAIMM_09198, partial [Cladophialophora immunda]